MRKLTPTREEVEALRRDAPPGPLVAVNLLKFKSSGGLAAYAKYMAAATAAAPADVKVLYTGKAGPDFGDGQDWDFVIIVEYANVESFASFVMSPAYQEQAAPHRPAALERTLWMASFPMSLKTLYEEQR